MSDETGALRAMDQITHIDDPARKQRYVTTMFEVIAPRYDRFTRWFSYGMDARWKRSLVDAVSGRTAEDAAIADLACGTGDLAIALRRRLPRARISGIDASPRMVELAQARDHGIDFAVGDLMALPHGDGALDAIVIGYGLRNVPDSRAAIAECVRVLRPGGILASLDFVRPSNRLWRALFLGYLAAMGALYGWWWHGHADVYRYIPRSIARFVGWRELSRQLREAGLQLEVQQPRLFGGICLHVARKP
jgi:demethylmenaquinone methyltransferase/2-methoxy-6-polyprenyl-1,4-benzoquinol methylase